MKKSCKECPWVVRNNNNNNFIKHSKKYNKEHNCHMIPKDKISGVWEYDERYQCYNNKKYLSKCVTTQKISSMKQPI